MRALGLGHSQIALEFARRYHLRPRPAWRLAQGWSLAEAATQINATAGTLGIDRVGRASMTGAHLSEYEQWPGPGERVAGRKPTPQVLALLCASYGAPDVRELLDIADYEHLPAADLLIFGKPPGRDVRVQQEADALSCGESPWPGHDPIASVAHESSEQAAAASRRLDEATLDQLRDDVARIARGYLVVSPATAFAQARQLREMGSRLLPSTTRPGQVVDLYFVIGTACALLAAASFDLGRWDAATEQARAAWIYGSQIGHPGLRSWAKGMQALIAYWSGNPAAAVTLVTEAQRTAPAGTAMVRLHCIEARAWAHLGRVAETERAIANSAAAREAAGGTEELHDQIGGQFGFDPARQARCHATTYLQLGKPKEAIKLAESAIRRYATMPELPGWQKIEAQAHADLAAARLSCGDLDGAHDALLPVLGLRSEQRVAGLTLRVQRVAGLLAGPAYRRSRPARQLGAQIDEFTTDTALPAIGSPPPLP